MNLVATYPTLYVERLEQIGLTSNNNTKTPQYEKVYTYNVYICIHVYRIKC